MKIKSSSLLIIFCFIAVFSFAQKETKKDSVITKTRIPSIKMIAVYYGDSVILRWAPSSWQSWKAGVDGGYVVERYEMDLSPDYFTEKNLAKRQVPVLNRKSKITLTKDPIKPYPSEVWKSKFDQGDTTSAMAAHLIYGQVQDVVGTKDVKPGAVLDALNEQRNLYALVLLTADRSASLAKGMGLSFVDKSIDKNKSYFYKVYIRSENSKMKFDSAGTIIQTFKPSELPQILSFTKQENDHKITIGWDKHIAAAYFTSYIIERSEDGGKTYTPRTHPIFTPLFDEQQQNEIIWSDSVPHNYKAYYYRVTGVTPFGINGKSAVFVCMGRDRTPPMQPQNVRAINTTGTTVEITWDKNQTDGDLSGYFIGKSSRLEGPFIPLSNEKISANTTSYIDKNASSVVLNYYIVAAIDTAGNTIASNAAYALMTDTIAPLQPKGLKAFVNEKGVVQLTWTIASEPDIAGYLVYAANDSSHAFTALSKEIVPVNAYLDTITLHSLTERRYYKVVALDKHKNVSIASNYIGITRPDTIAPVQPVFNDFKVTETSIKIFWNKSSSSDVVKQILFKKEADGEWKEFRRLEKNISMYLDDSVKTKIEYEYAIAAIDEAGNSSAKSYPLKARAYGKALEIKEKPVLTYNSEMKKIDVTWKSSTYSGEILIYRNFNGQGLLLYKSVEAKKGIFSDVQLNGAGKYEYALKVQLPDGTTSPLSKSESIVVK